DRFERRKEIGEQNEHPAFTDNFEQALQRRGEVSGKAAGGFFERQHEMAQMAGAMAGRQIIAQGLVEGQQANGVALQVKEISKGGSQGGRVLRLGEAERAKSHG